MVNVLCTVVFILGTGARQVEQLGGVMTDESGDSILVDFGAKVPEGQKQVRWVRENDCLYPDNPEAHYNEYLKNKELGEQLAKEQTEHWKQVVNELAGGKKK